MAIQVLDSTLLCYKQGKCKNTTPRVTRTEKYLIIPKARSERSPLNR